MGKLRGLSRLIHDAIDRTTDLVEETHESVARKTMRYLELAGPLAGPAKIVDEARRLTTSGVFATIHGINRAVGVATDGGLEVAERLQGAKGDDRAQAPLRSDAVGSLGWLGDTALGALNGVVGDYLHTSGNELALGMCLRHQDRYLPLERGALEQALPEATPKVVVFVHGLCCTEWSWCLKAEEHHGDPTVSFGTLLGRDLGYTPLYVRYNTGRHIADNGRLLAKLLEELVARAYPVEVTDLVLIGHSMGGLVIRSACAQARDEDRRWLEPLTHVVCLGSPHRGAPLEKLGSAVTAVLGAFDTAGTRIPARVLDLRSAGIKDLRDGAIAAAPGEPRDPGAELEGHEEEAPLLDKVSYCFISACVTDSPAHPLGQVVGDCLVRVPSALGPVVRGERFQITRHHHGGLHHFDLQNHPAVYEQIRRFCEGEAVES